MIPTPTRAAGLERLSQFLPHAGRDYAERRNFDLGPDDRGNVSTLSPWIRRRLITEEEVIAAVLARHGLNHAEKFIQEVVWRSYFKGWLEMRPAIWQRYQHDVTLLMAALDEDDALRGRHLAAITGRTGIACFDHWAGELTSTGWLHNHARMWFASIWIFTLRLPWQLGADFFYHHLLDADPASNTLSWRWVAGLHTAGKHYLARAENIARFTGGRFNPAGQLDEDAAPLTEPQLAPPPAPVSATQTVSQNRVGLLLHDDDLHPESWVISAQITAVALLPVSHGGAAPAAQFTAGALHDAAARAAAHFNCQTTLINPDHLADWARQNNLQEIVTSYAAVGPVADQLAALGATLATQNIRLVQRRRDWDNAVWPLATAGFFKVKAKIPQLVQHLV